MAEQGQGSRDQALGLLTNEQTHGWLQQARAVEIRRDSGRRSP